MFARRLITGLLALFALPAATRADAPNSPTTAPVTAPATTNPSKPAPFKATLDNVDDLRALQARVKTVLAKVAPAVVGLRVGGGQGSGVIISGDGYVLTAGHVASAPGRDVAVILADGRIVRGKTLGVNYGVDSGLVKITDKPPRDSNWPSADLGNSAQLQKGGWCVALGHPGGYKAGRTPPLRLGRILDTRGAFVRTDCTLVGGDSGGPLFDLDGRVIGIHSRIGQTLNDNMHVPVDTYRDTWARLAKGEAWGANFLGTRAGAPYLGLQVDGEAPDCRVGEVFPNGPAEAAGLKQGDVIATFAGQKVVNFGELQLLLAKQKPGDEVPVEIKRDGEKVKLKVTIGKRPRE